MLYKNILDLIGNTPIIEFQDIFIKLEQFNLAGSIKDRVALNMIEQLEKTEQLKTNSTVIEVTSGNTGIAIAMICAIKRYNAIIIMTDDASAEKINILKAYNAEVILTPKELGLEYAVRLAKKLEQEKGYFFLNQFENIDNLNAHINTALEIVNELDNVDYLVCGIGTGGTITTLGKVLKKYYKTLKVIGVEPSESAVISNQNNEISSHGICGIGPGFISKITDLNVIDEIMTVSTDEVNKAFFELSKKGLLLGKSSVASYIISKKIKEQNKDKVVLMISADSGVKYLNV